MTEISLGMQQALLGNVSSSLRAVTVEFDDITIQINCFFDGKISEEDFENMSCVETELLALLSEHERISYNVIRMDVPTHVPKKGIWVYLRSE